MDSKIVWNIFEKYGNIDAYMFYKELDAPITEIKEIQKNINENMNLL